MGFTLFLVVAELPLEANGTNVPVFGVMWGDQDGLIRQAGVSEGPPPDDMLRAGYEEATKRPVSGAPGVPKALITSNALMVRRLRKLLPDIAVEPGDTSHIDSAMSELAEVLSAGPEGHPAPASEQSMDDLAALSEADRDTYLRAFYRFIGAEPWIYYTDADPIAVAIPSAKITDGRIIIMGAGGQEFGFMLFRTAEKMNAFGQAVNGITDNLQALDFYSLNVELLPGLDSGEATPVPSASRMQPPSAAALNASELQMVVATLNAIAIACEEHGARLVSASRTGADFHIKRVVETLGGRRQVTLSAPKR